MKYFLYTVAQLFSPPSNVPKTPAGQLRVEAIMEVVFQVTAGISILIITIAGLTYVLSQGDSQRVARAKDAILYAIIGLVVSILGYSIVAFILTEFFE